MKKFVCIFLTIILMFSFAACANKEKNSELQNSMVENITNKQQGNETIESSQNFNDLSQGNASSMEMEDKVGINITQGQSSNESGVDVDLTTFSVTMAFAEVYNMMMAPEDYLGKNIKITGMYDLLKDIETGDSYKGIIIADATACCFQGLGLVFDDSYTSEEDYPQLSQEVTVVGRFEVDEVEDSGFTTYHLVDVYVVENGD